MSGSSRSYYLSIGRALKQIVVIIGAYQFYQLRTKFIQNPAVKINIYAEKTIGDNQCGFRPISSTTDHILCIRQILEKMEIQ